MRLRLALDFAQRALIAVLAFHELAVGVAAACGSLDDGSVVVVVVDLGPAVWGWDAGACPAVPRGDIQE